MAPLEAMAAHQATFREELTKDEEKIKTQRECLQIAKEKAHKRRRKEKDAWRQSRRRLP